MHPDDAAVERAAALLAPATPSAEDVAAAWTALTGEAVPCPPCQYRKLLYQGRLRLERLATPTPYQTDPMALYKFKKEHYGTTATLEYLGATISVDGSDSITENVARALVAADRGHLLESLPPELSDTESDAPRPIPVNATKADLISLYESEIGDVPADVKTNDQLRAAIEAGRASKQDAPNA